MSVIQNAPSWLVVLAAFGVVGICTALLTMFTHIGDRPKQVRAPGLGELSPEAFMRPVAGLLGVPQRRGGAVELINNGDAWISALLSDIAAASHSITFAVYIWEPGQMSDVIVEALTDRARADVKVRVLLDGLGCIRCPKEAVAAMRASGIAIARFRPARIGKITRFNQRNHRRAIVIDGCIGYTGGMAVGDKWLGDARNDGEWRDTMVRVTGCAVESVQQAFAELWANVTGEALIGPEFFPVLEGEDTALWSMGVVSSPAPEEHPMGLFLLLTFHAARHRLWITTPYFVPDEHMVCALEERARAGVDVRLLLPDDHIDAKIIRRASQHYYERLLVAGARIFEFQGTMMHTKLIVADSTFSIVGSANLDIRSNELNQENVLGIHDSSFAADVEATFEADLKRAREIRLDEWKRRGIDARVLERTFAFFQEQF